MKKLFMVIRSRGPAWNSSRSMDEQVNWEAHARFMDGLKEAGFILLGGPLEGTSDVLLIIEAGGEFELRSRLSADPWSADGLLEVTRVAPWKIRLGTLG